MYSANFDRAAAEFQQASAIRASNPEPAFFVGLTSLWRQLYFGYDDSTNRALSASAEQSFQEADRLVTKGGTARGTAYFWRGMGRSLRVAALLLPRALQSERRNLGVVGLLTGVSVLADVHAAEGDFRAAVASDPSLKDARAMSVLLAECQSADVSKCVTDLWSSLEGLQWVDVELKYILLNMIYNQRSLDGLRERGAPIAVELHLKYPSNGLFHLTLAKLGYEVGDLAASRAYSREILAAAYANVFGHEARYLLGLSAGEQSQWAEALPYFTEIVKAAPINPPYLLRWSLLRAAQCEQAIGHAESALGYANRALASGRDDVGLQDSARRLIAVLNDGARR